MWHPDGYLEKLYRESQMKRSQGEAEAWEQKSVRLRSKLKELLGDFDFSGSAFTRAELNPVLLERVELEDVIRERVEYSTEDGLRVPAYVLIPKHAAPGKLPAVLAWHGHGYGSREIVGLCEGGAENRGEPGIHRNFALELARRGMLVLAPEIIGFGDRKLQYEVEQDPALGNSCFSIGAALLLHGKTIAGLRTYEAIRAADYLAAREEVDPGRIGCMGFSGGGMVASLAAALDQRLQAVVLCGYPSTYKASIMKRRHCLDNYIPGILQAAEMPELLGLIAPRALFIESGLSDHLFPASQVHEAARVLSGIYKQWKAESRFAYELFEGKHEISGRSSFDWLAATLCSL